jgi:hypothetical protein
MREPTKDDLGVRAEWSLEEENQILVVEGDLIGFASSRTMDHTHESKGRPLPGVKCRGCRWFEVRIIDADGKYVIHRTGKSAVPGESRLFTPTVIVATAIEVVEALKDPNGGKMSGPAKEALKVAAEYDDDIDALLNPHKALRRIS